MGRTTILVSKALPALGDKKHLGSSESDSFDHQWYRLCLNQDYYVILWTESISSSTERLEWDWNITATTLTSALSWNGRCLSWNKWKRQIQLVTTKAGLLKHGFTTNWDPCFLYRAVLHLKTVRYVLELQLSCCEQEILDTSFQWSILSIFKEVLWKKWGKVKKCSQTEALRRREISTEFTS